MQVRENIDLGAKVSDSQFMCISTLPENFNFHNCTGYWYDVAYNHVTEKTERIGDSFNIIVESIGRLVAGLFRSDPAFRGIQQWAIGVGSSSWDALWDTDSPPTALSTATRLTNEIGRLPISIAGHESSMIYVDQDGEPSQTPTNRIKVSRMFGRADGNGEWREFALFGGNAGSARDSGIMINHKIHRVINKTGDMTVERNIIFTFN